MRSAQRTSRGSALGLRTWIDAKAMILAEYGRVS
jgi:hypothetical protein